MIDDVIVGEITIVLQFGTFFFSVTVSRLHCESESFKMDLVLDVNTWLYPMELGMWNFFLS